MGFLSDACDRIAAELIEPRQLDFALPAVPQANVIPPEVGPPRHYRICDRMLGPSYFYGSVEGLVDFGGKFGVRPSSIPTRRPSERR